jgi:hypothetical protein
MGNCIQPRVPSAVTRAVVVALASASATALVATSQLDSGLVVIRDVRVFDGTRTAEHRTVVIGNGIVASVGDAKAATPTGAESIDGTGRTLLPGLIDAHVHVSPLLPELALRQSLAFGVTTVINMWTSPPPKGFAGKSGLVRMKELEASDAPDVADLRTAGTGATATGGHPTQMDGGPAAAVPTLDAPEQARAFVDARLAEGSDFIKIIYDDASASYGNTLPMLTRQTLAALAAAAHAHGRLAIAHIGTEPQAMDAINAGVDGLAHVFVGPTVSDDFVRLAAGRRIFVIPTLSILYAVCGRPRRPADSRRRPRDGTRAPGIQGHAECAGCRQQSVVRRCENSSEKVDVRRRSDCRGNGRARSRHDVRRFVALGVGASCGRGHESDRGIGGRNVGGGARVSPHGSRTRSGGPARRSLARRGQSSDRHTRDAERHPRVEERRRTGLRP